MMVYYIRQDNSMGAELLEGDSFTSFEESSHTGLWVFATGLYNSKAFFHAFSER